MCRGSLYHVIFCGEVIGGRVGQQSDFECMCDVALNTAAEIDPFIWC